MSLANSDWMFEMEFVDAKHLAAMQAASILVYAMENIFKNALTRPDEVFGDDEATAALADAMLEKLHQAAELLRPLAGDVLARVQPAGRGRKG